jgi:xylulokinase
VLEGVAYEVRVNAEHLRQSGIVYRSLRASGGCARSKAWLQIKADVLNVPIERLSNDEAGTVGGILLTALAQGMFHSVGEAAEAMVRVTHTVEPRQKMVQAYNEHFARYRELYEAVRPFANTERESEKGGRSAC